MQYDARIIVGMFYDSWGDIIFRNCSFDINPVSPSVASSIISSMCRLESFCPSWSVTCQNENEWMNKKTTASRLKIMRTFFISSALMNPFLSTSKMSKISLYSLASLIFLLCRSVVMKFKNSEKSIAPFLSVSISSIRSPRSLCNKGSNAFFGLW